MKIVFPQILLRGVSNYTNSYFDIKYLNIIAQHLKSKHCNCMHLRPSYQNVWMCYVM